MKDYKWFYLNVVSIKEVIINKETGILINQGNYEEFIKQLIRIKNDDILKKKLALNGFEYINENYNIENYEDKIRSLYKELIK